MGQELGKSGIRGVTNRIGSSEPSIGNIEKQLRFQLSCSFCPFMLDLVVISFIMDCCSKRLEMSNKSNLLCTLQDNTSYTSSV